MWCQCLDKSRAPAFSCPSPSIPRVESEGDASEGAASNDETVTLPDGSVYRGQLVKGSIAQGFGTLKNPSNVYTGQFVDGQLHGMGTQKSSDGKLYVGQWHQGKYHGKGTFTWPDGKRYQGEYSENVKHGHGYFEWPDGSWFEGQFVDGKQHGQGKTCKKKDIKNGLWVDGKRVT